MGAESGRRRRRFAWSGGKYPSDCRFYYGELSEAIAASVCAVCVFRVVFSAKSAFFVLLRVEAAVSYPERTRKEKGKRYEKDNIQRSRHRARDSVQ
ncbi:MAG: hypothetical protein ILO64_06530 [Clostridia bacterium]|nr:hypothetical protein [Clostridia bacterium]